MAHSSPPRLRILFGGSRCDSLIIVVPDVAATPPEHWCSSSEQQPWLKTLFKETAPNARFFCFVHSQESTRAFQWQEIRKSSEELLNELFNLRKDATYAEAPIQIICFGLGGLVVKEALQSAHRQPTHFGDLLFVLASVAFFVTPHSTSESEDSWKTLALIPKIRNKALKKRKLEKDDILSIARTCRQFEDMSLDRPILSIYEEQETTVQSSLPGPLGTSKILIVGKSRCSVKSNAEEIISLNTDFAQSCLLSVKSDVFFKLKAFLQTSISAAQLRIMVKMSRQEPQIPDDCYTVRTYSVLDGKSSSQRDTNAGTTGSTTASYQVVPSATDFVSARKDPQLPCYMYGNRIRNHAFLSRQDVLRTIEECLLPDARKHTAVAGEDIRSFSICGLGGIGKSEIATEFMFSHLDYFDAVFWLQADQTTMLRDGFSHMAVKLGLEERQEAKDQIVSTNLVKAWLAQPLKRTDEMEESEGNLAKWLVIFDNVDNPDDLNEFWPQFGRGSVLITSRDPLSKTNVYSGSSGTDLSPLSDTDGARLLLKLTNSGVSDSTEPTDKALEVAHRLGGLPLGITQMAGIINRKDYTFDEFLKRYDEKSLAEMHDQPLGWQNTGYTHTIASVWALEQLSEGTSALLDVISLLNPDGIQEEVLTTGQTETNLDCYPNDEISYQEARADLTRRSLVVRNKLHLELRVHRLTQEVARAKMSVERLKQVFASAVKLIYSLWPFPTMGQRHNIGRWQLCERLMPHVLTLHELYASYIHSSNLFVAAELFAQLLTDAAGYLLERGGSSEFEKLLYHAEAICKAQQHDARDLLSEIHYIRGAQATEMNNKELALPNNLAYLQLRIDLAEITKEGTKDPKLAHAYNQAGNAYLNLGNVEKAISLYERSLETFRSIPGHTELNCSIPVANLGSAFWVAGRLEEAAQVLGDNLEARILAFGIDDTESFRTGRLLFGLANVRASQGQLAEAYKLHRRALAQYRSTLGENHHRTADLCYKVAEHYIRLGQIESAISLLDQAEGVYSSKPYFIQELARAKFKKSQALSQLGKSDEAETYRRQALEMYRAVVVDDRRPDEDIEIDTFDAIVTYASR